MNKRKPVRGQERVRYRKDTTGARRRVAVRDGVEGFIVEYTRSCSGCYEPGEYETFGSDYKWDDKAKCRIGAGCSECGYTGKRRERMWFPFDDKDEP